MFSIKKQTERIKKKIKVSYLYKKINKELTYLWFESFPSQISGLKTKRSNSFTTFKTNLVAIAQKYTNTITDKSQFISTKEVVNTTNTIKTNN